MNRQELEAALVATLDDEYLSRSERTALREVLGEQDEESLRFVRNLAFELVEERVDRVGDRRELLKWLHGIVRAIDAARSAAPDPGEAFFSPGEACRRRILQLIGGTERSLDVCVFTITDNALRDALAAAHERSVRVRIIADDDKAYDRGSDVYDLASRGVPVRFDRTEAHMHHKFAIADGRELLTGSYNWTRSAASSNQENLVVLREPGLIGRYSEVFEVLWKAFAAG